MITHAPFHAHSVVRRSRVALAVAALASAYVTVLAVPHGHAHVHAAVPHTEVSGYI